MSNPIAVLIADVHYNIQTLPLADAAMRQAIAKANELNVPLIVAGDLHDTKANMRAECMNAMIETFKLCDKKSYIIVGNHDRVNEKSYEHSLNFLAPYAIVINSALALDNLKLCLISYQSNPNDLLYMMRRERKGHMFIVHQGIVGSDSGEYIQDKSAITAEDVADFRVISGHYHKRQDIKCGRPRQGALGLFSYIGNPYTLAFGEANDPPKGFQILMDDGLLEFVPTNLRKHVIIDIDLNGPQKAAGYNRGDLVWVKVKGTKEQLMNVTKKSLNIAESFRLDLIPTDTTTEAPAKTQTNGELLDSLIDSLSNTSDDRKDRLKKLWKSSTCG